MKLISGGITTPIGFKAAGVHCGIKKRKLDLGLLYSEHPAQSAAVFTINKLNAPHIEIDRKNIKKSKIQAILVNSGNANCYNGRRGLNDVKDLIKKLSKSLKVKEESVLFASTGIIGEPLPTSLIKKKIPALVGKLNLDSKDDFAHAILTTDTKIKQVAIKVKLDNKDVIIAVCAKGSGMIYPHMATTLCFIATDAQIKKRALQKALKLNIDKSLNLISVDGDMSPNDMVIALANGQAKNKIIDINSKSFIKFSKALYIVLNRMSEMIIEDAEGATKSIKIHVTGARTLKDAKQLAFAIANSNLVKTAFYGEDPNWGRIISCIGSSGVYLKPKKVEVLIDKVKFFKNFEPIRSNIPKLKRIFKRHKIEITVNLNAGNKVINVQTCDLTNEYVKINAHYRT